MDSVQETYIDPFEQQGPGGQCWAEIWNHAAILSPGQLTDRGGLPLTGIYMEQDTDETRIFFSSFNLGKL